MVDGRAVSDGPVSKRRVIPPDRIPGSEPESFVKEEEVVCSRCSFGNPKDESVCQQCNFSLHLTKEELESIEGRLSGVEHAALGVEDDSDEGEVHAKELIEELKEVPFFAELGSKSLVKILPVLERLSFSKGSLIVKQGDDGDSFYTVRDGNVRVVLQKEGSQDVAIAQLGPKEGFGEMALLADQPRSATVVAVTDVQVWRLPKDGFDLLLAENVSLALYFNRLLTQRLGSLEQKIVP